MEIRRAALISAIGRYSKIILSIIVTAMLARILSANDYGIVAIITVFSTFFTTLSDMGFGAAVIQNRTLSKRDIDNIFSFTVYVAIILAILFCLFSVLIANFYGNGVYILLGQVLSVSLLFNALNMVPNGILNRDKKFILIAIRTVVVYIISGTIAVILAMYGWRYYAIAFQAVLTAFLTFIWNYLTVNIKFHFVFNFKSVKKVINYSGYQFAFNIVNYFSRNLDNLLTGKFLGSRELGYYNKSYELMLYPVNNLTGVVSPVLHPILSDFQNEHKIIYDKYMKVVKLLSLLAIYIAPFCMLSASEIINILYGSNWNSSIVCFQLLSIAIFPQMINSSAGSVFQALGKTKLLFINSCINTLVTVISILVGVIFGKSIVVLSFCVSISYVIHLLTAFTMLIVWGFHYDFAPFFKEIFPELVMLVIMFFVTALYNLNIDNILISLIIKFIYLLVVYTILLIVTKEYKIFLKK